MPKLAALFVCLLATAVPLAHAGELRGTLPPGGLTVMVLAADGRAASASGERFTLSSGNGGGRLVVLDADTSVRGPVVLAIKAGRKLVPVAKAIAKHVCGRSGVQAVLRFKASTARKPANLGTLVVGDRIAYPRKKLPAKLLDTTSGLAAVDASCAPLGAGRLGITGPLASAVRRDVAVGASSPDKGSGSADGASLSPESDADGDGMPGAFDADDDGDGILDNDDPDSQAQQRPDGHSSFWVFSNLHLNIEDSVNANAMPVTAPMIDEMLRTRVGLAMQVVSGVGPVELDCGSLSYCSAGGTGKTREPYPDGLKFPEAVDPDGNGFGTLTPGPTGDFQYAPFGAAPAGTPASQLLRAGDVYRERYAAADGTVVEVPGMLNFVFHTTPAVKTVTTGVRTYDVHYPVVVGDPGTAANPFHVPTTGPVVVTMTVWRPQRAGIAAAGEADLVDMGRLRLVTTMPQGPCGGPGGFDCKQGPGLCPPTVYTTTDPNLQVRNDGLQDKLGDRAADPADTFTYAIDLTACLETVPGVTWEAGERLMLPVQMVNVYSDNAAQTIFFVRDDG